MTVLNSGTSCPLCSSKSISLLTEETMICEECSFVFGSDTTPVETTPSQNTNSVHPNSRDKTTNWSETVSVKDSSDAILVDIITNAESLVRSLGGDADARIHTVELVVDAWQQQYFRGRTAKSVIAAAVYLSFRERRRPRPLGIVATTSDLSRKRLQREIRSFQKITNLGTAVSTPEEYLLYLSTQLSIDSEMVAESRRLLRSSGRITGDPAAIAGAAIYLATQGSDRNITLAEAGEATGVTKETIWCKKRDLLKSRAEERSDPPT